MQATAELRREHALILDQASVLSGLASSRMTRDIAVQTHERIAAIDRLLVDHLTREDTWLYPSLMAADDHDVRLTAGGCFEDMGGILGAWVSYRDHWSAANMLAGPERFRTATDGVIGALAIRIERENRELYPLMDDLVAATDAAPRAA